MTYDKHRFVYNKNDNICYIEGASSKYNNGTINEAGALLIDEIYSHKNDKKWLSEFYQINKPFCNDLYKEGWIDENIQLQGRLAHVPTPYHLRYVQIETLLKCNLSCGYCYCGAGSERKEYISEPMMIELLNDAARLGAMMIDFTGGEFFLRPDWERLIRHTRSLGLTVAIHTNGMALTERNVEVLQEVGIVRVQVSADSSQAELHNKIRGHAKAYDFMIRGAERLLESGIPTIINLMVHKENYQRIREDYYFFKNKGFGLAVDWIAPYGSEQDNRHGISIADYFEAVKDIPELRELADDKKPCGRELGKKINDYEPP